MTSHRPDEREYCTANYEAASGNWDIFCVFAEKAINLCKKDGLTSFIVPNKLGSAGYAEGARDALAVENRLLTIRDFSNVSVFPVAVYPIVYIVEKRKRPKQGSVVYERMEVDNEGSLGISLSRELDYERYFSQAALPWAIFATISDIDPVKRMRLHSVLLEEVAQVAGAATVAEAYELKALIEDGSEVDSESLKMINSGTIDRYSMMWGEKSFRYLGNSYLRPIVSPQQQPKMPNKRRSQAKTPKIVVAGMTKILECVVDIEGSILAGKSTTVIFSSLNLCYLIGLLNSRLINFYYATVFGGNRLQGGYLRIGPPQLRTVPTRAIDFSNPDDVEMHDRMVSLVERMLGLHERLREARSPWDQDRMQADIASTERRIDGLVYELYGLTDEEIELVEGADGA